MNMTPCSLMVAIFLLTGCSQNRLLTVQVMPPTPLDQPGLTKACIVTSHGTGGGNLDCWRCPTVDSVSVYEFGTSDNGRTWSVVVNPPDSPAQVFPINLRDSPRDAAWSTWFLPTYFDESDMAVWNLLYATDKINRHPVIPENAYRIRFKVEPDNFRCP